MAFFKLLKSDEPSENAVIRARLDSVEADLRKLNAETSQLRLEWLETLDKTTRLFGRMVKRAALDEAQEEEEPRGVRSRLLRQSR